ncbi:MAG: flagellar basal-body rod protein FlgG [Longimicrobiales bacterium]
MDPGLRTAATGMAAQQTRIDVIANNLANVNTPGFKRSQAHFEDLLYQTISGEQMVGGTAADVTPAVQIGRGTRLAAVQRVHEQGTFEITGRPLDLAIDGDGLFQVRRPDGTSAYTRDGSFTISDQGVLVTSGGYAVIPEVRIPEDMTEVTVSRTGMVSATGPGQAAPVEIGQVELVRFPNLPGLLSLGENLYQETAASGQPIIGAAQEDGFGRIIQGALEASNVEVVQEMVEMIAALRAYEINAKAVEASEQMADTTNQMVR